MPTNPQYVTQPVPSSPYRVDGRVTVGKFLGPETKNIHGGPHVNVVSGVRANTTIWPSGS